MGIDEEIAAFYNKGNQAPCLGSNTFREWAFQQRKTDAKELNRETLQFFRPGIEQITETVARCFKVDPKTIINNQRERVNENIPRWVVMYIAQEKGGLKLCEIANYLELKRTGSIPMTIAKLKSRMLNDSGVAKIVESIKNKYYT